VTVPMEPQTAQTSDNNLFKTGRCYSGKKLWLFKKSKNNIYKGITMKKKIVALCILGALLVSSAVYAQNYTGNGGKGVNLAVLIPEGRGLSADQAYLPTMVQGVFVADLTKYSAMSVIDRANLEKVLKETESGIYKEADFAKLGEINVDHFLTGSLTKTSSGFSFQIQITGTKDVEIKASYSGACTIAEFDNYVAIKKASLALLEGMGISLTTQARTELQQAAAQQTIQAQTLTAQGIAAQRDGRETEAMSFFSQAATIDPSLLEAASRLNVLSRNVSSGSIGADARNDVQWRKDWIARLTEAEQYFDRFFKTYNQPYALIQLTGLEHGKTDYQTESMPISFKVDFRESDAGRWTGAVTAAANPVLNGLNQTGKKSEWGLDNWPRSRVSNVAPFNGGSKRFSIVAELLNDKNKVIGTQTFNTSGSWSFNFDSGISMKTSTSGVQTVTFPRVKVDDITDLMTIRFASVDGKAADAVAKSGVLQITTQADYLDADGFDYNGGGYGWDGYDKAGYDKEGYDKDGYNRYGYGRDGFNRDGYDLAGYGRDDFNQKGFNRDGHTADGSLYDKEGYNKAGYNANGFKRDGYDINGYDKAGYDKNGYNRSGYKRWSPVPSYFEALISVYPISKLFGGFTLGLLGAYASFSFKEDGNTLADFIAGYAVNLLREKRNRSLLGLSVPFGIGQNNVENQTVLEIGLQIRLYDPDNPTSANNVLMKHAGLAVRGTYRTIGFKDNSFTLSVGFCWFVSTFNIFGNHADGRGAEYAKEISC